MLVLKIFIILLAVVGLLILFFFIVFEDSLLVYWYLFNKKNLRYKLFRKYKKDNLQIYALGTAHDMHFILNDYSFLHLKAILVNLRPDVLLLESRQEEINENNLADGPIEMFYLHMIAKKMHIPVIGIDWSNPKLCKPGTTNKIRDNHIIENIVNGITGFNKPLVVYGGTHMLVGEKILKKKGFVKQKISKEQQDLLFKIADNKLIFPKETKKYVDIRISRAKLFLNNKGLSDIWKKAVNNEINNLTKFKEKIENHIYEIES